MPTESKKTKNTPTFEETLARLEEIADILENESPALDEALTLYEEGTKLLKKCAAELESAEAKITVLTKGEEEADA